MKHILLTLLLVGAAVLEAVAQSSPRLIPFQGRLTDQSGVVYSSGQYTIIFTLYDQPVGGSLLWSERHEKVGVINGMVNVFLGSIRNFDAPGGTNAPVTFSSTRYLGITIDTDGNANTPDPEMIPRQMIIPAFWAKTADNANMLGGYDWTPLFGVNNPTVAFPGSKIGVGTIPGTALVNGAIGSNQIANASIRTNHFAGQIDASFIADGAVTPAKQALRSALTNSPAALGNIALSTLIDFQQQSSFSTTPLPNASVSLITRGGPVWVGLCADTNAGQASHVYTSYGAGGQSRAEFKLFRNGVQISVAEQLAINGNELLVPVSSFRFLDPNPPAGTHTYSISVNHLTGDGFLRVKNARMFAFEH